MNILALETSAGKCSAAVLQEGNILAYNILETINKQSEQSIQLIDKTLKEANLKLSQIDFLAVCLGPGSFTGIRVGIAAIEGISLFIAKPIIGISSLECLAFSHTEAITCALAAGRDQFFVQKFLDSKPENKISIIDSSEMLVYTGNAKIIGNFVHKTIPDAKMLASAAYGKAREPNFQIESSLSPIYVREPSIGGIPNKN